MNKRSGLIQIYTGNGKGKTTAAIGLAVRASGAGLKVFILQFLKKGDFNEIKTLKKIKNITIKQCGRSSFVNNVPTPADMKCAKKGLYMAIMAVSSGNYNIVILDEINVALKLGLVDIDDVLDILKKKKRFCEIILTGRHCPSELFSFADLVTEMREVKHPFARGVKARSGIEH